MTSRIPFLDARPKGLRLELDHMIHAVVVVTTASIGLVFAVSARFESRSWSVNAPVAVVVALAMIIPVVLRPRSHPFRPVRHRLSVVGTAGGAVAVAASQVLDSTLFPVSTGVDVAHHLTLVRWITEHGGVPSTYTSNLGEMYVYPFGAHSIAAVIAKVGSIDPIRAMNLTGYVILGLLAAAVATLAAAVARHAVRGVSQPVVWATSVMAVGGLFMGHQFFFDALGSDYFLGQIFGMYLLVVGVMFAIEGFDDVGHLWLAAVAGAALVFAYPLYLPVLATAFAVVVVALWARGRMRRALHGGALLAGPTLVASIAFFPGRTEIGRAILNNEGAIRPVTMSALGGWPLVLLMAGGAAVLILTAVRGRHWRLLTVPACVTAAVICRVALTELSSSDFGSRYQATKYVYAAWLFGLAMVPTTVTVALKSMAQKWRPLAGWLRRPQFVLLACVALLVYVGFGPLYAARNPIVTQSEYVVASWAASHLDVAEIEIADQNSGAYLMWVAVLDRPRDQDALDLLAPPTDNRLVEWVSGESTYLMVNDAAEMTAVAELEDIEVVFQVDQAAIVERRPER